MLALTALIVLIAGIESGHGAERLQLLDVPYVAQREARLCGGAAAEMVLRYWGCRELTAEHFAALVEPELGGIRTDSLAAALRRHGWSALRIAGDRAAVSSHLARGRPLIVLLGDEDGGHHYVVVTGWHDGTVFFHDPAVGPFRTSPAGEFATDWERGAHWALLVTPGEDPVAPATARGADSAAPTPERPWSAPLRSAVSAARAGRLDPAADRLAVALQSWPDTPELTRALAGVRFRQQRYDEAAALALRTVAVSPADSHAWRILGACRFLADDTNGALDAWRRGGRSRLDLVEIGGLQSVRPAVVHAQLAPAVGKQLSGEDLLLLRRRVEALPAVERSRLAVVPASGDRLDLRASVLEAPSLVDGGSLPFDVAAAVVERELGLDWVSPSGAGEVYHLRWRWWPNRPRIGLGVAVPGLLGGGGVTELSFFAEKQSYAVGPSPDGVARSHRRRASLGWRHWLTARQQFAAAVALDRWRGRGDWLAGRLRWTLRDAGDRLALRLGGEGWQGIDGSPPMATASVSLGGRPLAGTTTELSAVAGYSWASADAPVDLWPAAGALATRGIPLRAHPLLDDGVVIGGHLGRSLWHGSLEATRWLLALGVARLGAAAVLDAVHTGTGGSGWDVDAGIGLRLGGPASRRVLRLDLGRGLLDGAAAVSLAWQSAWPDPFTSTEGHDR